MTSLKLTNQILALPVDERVAIAQRVWESIEGELPVSPDSAEEAVAIARQRDEEMSSGDCPGTPHEDFMNNARRSIECK